jgi:hypothetical protein
MRQNNRARDNGRQDSKRAKMGKIKAAYAGRLLFYKS